MGKKNEVRSDGGRAEKSAEGFELESPVGLEQSLMRVCKDP